MARRSKVDAEKTRSRILETALALFVKKGYEHTTFTDIAARMKMTKGAVYWHFASKEKLLVALVEHALERFRVRMEQALPDGELTYPAVTGMMVRSAASLVRDRKGAEFFRLLKCQIRWSSASMDSVREDLLTNTRFGPKQAFKSAIAADMAAGRVRADVDGEEIATVSIALWDGLVQSAIDGFLASDLVSTLSHAYAAIWRDIRVQF